MTGGMRSDNIIEAIGHTPLVELARMSPRREVRIFAKLEGQNTATGSVKDRIARYMIEKAEERGELTPGKTIIEATSGNTGIALAMIGRRKGYKVKVVMPENVSLERRLLLELFGAEVILTEGERGVTASFELAMELSKDKAYYMPNQFENPLNPLAHYETTGAEILEAMSDLDIDVLIAGMGTGGTIVGVGKRLKEQNPNTRVIGVEPPPNDFIPGLRCLEEGFIPPIIDMDIIDQRVYVSSRDAIAATKELLKREGIFAGISSGAALYSAIKIAQGMERGNIIVILPDGGWKYLSMDIWGRDANEVS